MSTLNHRKTLEILLTEMSHYVDLGASAEAVMYYQSGGRAHIRLPDGKAMHGNWTLRDDGYDVDWENGPSGSWSFDYVPGVISYVDGAGKTHGPVTRIVPGDAEGLAA